MYLPTRYPQYLLPFPHCFGFCPGVIEMMRAASELSASRAPEYPRAIFFYRKMHGVTQSSLVRASNGRLYVVKQSSRQGNTFAGFNESFGYELAKSLKLPVPHWSPVLITDDFIDQNPGFWPGEGGENLRPSAGLHFGSQLVCSVHDMLLDSYPRAFVQRITNRRDFNGILALDTWANHMDVRQALFVTKQHRSDAKAFFIDFERYFMTLNGMLGRKVPFAMYPNRAVYQRDCFVERSLRGWAKKIAPYDESALRALSGVIPREWFTEGRLVAVIAGLLLRKEMLPGLIEDAIEILSVASRQRVSAPNAALRLDEASLGWMAH